MANDERQPPDASAAPEGATSGDRRLVAALRAGDEAAFADLLDRYHAPMLRLATTYVRDRAIAEEVVQDTWLAVLRGIDRVGGRSSFKTWLFRILVNQAIRRHEREAGSVPFSALERPDAAPADPAVDPDRFLPPDVEWAGHWSSPPRPWGETPEEWLLSAESGALIEAAIAALPPRQRTVITLRDVAGWTGARSAPCSGSAKRTSGCCSTAPARSCAGHGVITWTTPDRAAA